MSVEHPAILPAFKKPAMERYGAKRRRMAQDDSRWRRMAQDGAKRHIVTEIIFGFFILSLCAYSPTFFRHSNKMALDRVISSSIAHP
jgi:hypothetical protein